MSHNWYEPNYPKDISPLGRRVLLYSIAAGIIINTLVTLGVIVL